jgi:hypothetical protein
MRDSEPRPLGLGTGTCWLGMCWSPGSSLSTVRVPRLDVRLGFRNSIPDSQHGIDPIRRMARQGATGPAEDDRPVASDAAPRGRAARGAPSPCTGRWRSLSGRRHYPGADRRFTGSYEAASFDPKAMPVTHCAQSIGVGSLTGYGRRFPVATLEHCCWPAGWRAATLCRARRSGQAGRPRPPWVLVGENGRTGSRLAPPRGGGSGRSRSREPVGSSVPA